MLSTALAQPSGREQKCIRLRDIIRARSIRHGKFRLASGGESNVFFDMKMTLLDPEGLSLAADLVLELVEREGADAVGGLVIGACPIVDAVCLKSYGRKPLKGFYVRKEPKTRGTEKLIEGPLEPGSKVVVLEDVTTRGGSALKAVEAVRAWKCEVRKVITIVDREEGAEDHLKRHGIELVPLFRMQEFDQTQGPTE